MKRIFLIVLASFIMGCSSDDSSTDDDDTQEETSCENLPQFPDEEHENLFNMVGNSCVISSAVSVNQLGSATFIESNATENCTVNDVHFFKLHLGYASLEDESLTFDVDVFFLTDQLDPVGQEFDLSSDEINAYYSYTENSTIITTKITSGTLSFTNTDEAADFYGSFEASAEEFELDQGVDSAVKGNGSFVENGNQVTLEGRLLAQDRGLSPDCQ